MQEQILSYYLELLSDIEKERSIVRSSLQRLKVLNSELHSVVDLHRSLFPSEYYRNGLARSNNFLFASSNANLPR